MTSKVPSCEVCGQYHGSVIEEERCMGRDRERLRREVYRLEQENRTLSTKNAGLLTECLRLARALDGSGAPPYDKAAE